MEFTGCRAVWAIAVSLLLILSGCQTPISLMRLPEDGVSGQRALAQWQSQLSVGDEVAAFNPRHVIGPDAGTNLCPICTYLDATAVLIFAKQTANTVSLANRLETLAATFEPKGLHIFLVITDGTEAEIQQMARANDLNRISISVLEPESRADDLAAWKIDANNENTVVIYRDYIIQWKKNELRAAEFDELEGALQSELQIEKDIQP